MFQTAFIVIHLNYPIAVVDKSWHRAYIRPRYCGWLGMFIAELDNTANPLLSMLNNCKYLEEGMLW
jgi:hypothetical protein